MLKFSDMIFFIVIYCVFGFMMISLRTRAVLFLEDFVKILNKIEIVAPIMKSQNDDFHSSNF